MPASYPCRRMAVFSETTHLYPPKLLLGGRYSPRGDVVTFIRSELDTVVELAQQLWSKHHAILQHTIPSLEGAVSFLSTMSEPFNRESFLACRSGWVAYLNNGRPGGDISAIGPALLRELRVEGVAAENRSIDSSGHSSIQIWIMDGRVPALMVRSVELWTEDGAWGWQASGEPLEFEQLSRYEARRKRDRFDRALLCTYLAEFGIEVDDAAFYGAGLGLSRDLR